MKKDGFTLVELLAVIVILGILMLIAVPVVKDAIEHSRKESFRISVKGIYDAIEHDQVEHGYSENNIYRYESNKLYKEKENGKYFLEPQNIKLKGKIKEGSGQAVATHDGDILIAVGNGDWCAYNVLGENDILIKDGDCTPIDDPAMYPAESCFTFDDISATVLKYDKSDPTVCPMNVIMPPSIRGIDIETIGPAAFVETENQTCYSDVDRTYVTMPDGFIHEDGDGYSDCGFAFKDVQNRIISVDLSRLHALRTIKYYAFFSNDYPGIEKINLKNLLSLRVIENDAFSGLSANEIHLENLDNLVDIQDYAFANEDATSIVLKNLNALEHIGSRAFRTNNDDFDNASKDLIVRLENLPQLFEIDTYAFRSGIPKAVVLKNLPRVNYLGINAFCYTNPKKITKSKISVYLNSRFYQNAVTCKAG